MGNSESKAERLNAQGRLGAQEFIRSGNVRKINLAVRLLTQAVKAAGPDHPKLAEFLSDQGHYGGFLYERTGDEKVFMQSIQAYDEALELVSEDYYNRPVFLMTYGDVLMKRYQREKLEKDLKRAEELYEDSVRLTPSGNDNRATTMTSLASCLLSKFEKTKDPDDLNKAIKCCQDGIEASEYGDSPVWGYSVLSGCYLERFKAAKSSDDLDEAFKAAQGALDYTPDHPDGLNALTKCLNAKFQQTQSLSDIDEAIERGSKAVEGAQVCRMQWEESLCILGDQYDAKYAKTGKMGDLNNIIWFREELVKVLGPADPGLGHAFHLLCSFRFKKYLKAKDGKVLLEAISAGDQGASVVWPVCNNQERAEFLDLLASCYGAKLAKKDLLGKSAAKDLEKAISYGEEALKLMGPDDPLREKTLKKVKGLKVDGFYEEPKDKA